MAKSTVQPMPRSDASQAHRAPAAVVAVRRLFATETRDYFLLLGTTLFLVVFGLVMVLSASSVESHLENDSFFAAFLKQALYALVALPLMLVASRMPIAFWMYNRIGAVTTLFRT